MKKVKVVKKNSLVKTKRISNTKKPIPRSSSNIDKVLIENFITLQRVMTNLSLKFDNLSSQISKLLQLFEITAKTIAKGDFKPENSQNPKEVLKKLDSLPEQNKTIARGLTLMHEFNSQKRLPSHTEFQEERMHIEESDGKI